MLYCKLPIKCGFFKLGKKKVKKQLKGISKGLSISGEGIIQYTVTSDDCTDISIK